MLWPSVRGAYAITVVDENDEDYDEDALNNTLTPLTVYELADSTFTIFPNGTAEYEGITNLDLSIWEWVYNGDGTIASSQGAGVEQGQHATNLQAIRNYLREDGTPDDPEHPGGLSGWIAQVVNEF